MPSRQQCLAHHRVPPSPRAGAPEYIDRRPPPNSMPMHEEAVVVEVVAGRGPASRFQRPSSERDRAPKCRARWELACRHDHTLPQVFWRDGHRTGRASRTRRIARRLVRLESAAALFDWGREWGKRESDYQVPQGTSARDLLMKLLVLCHQNNHRFVFAYPGQESGPTSLTTWNSSARSIRTPIGTTPTRSKRAPGTWPFRAPSSEGSSESSVDLSG